MSFTLGAAVLASLSLQEAAFGGALQPRIVEGTADAPAGAFFVGGYTSPGGSERHVVQFYAIRDPSDRSLPGVPYVSVPVARRSLETPEGARLESWADGRSCGALYGVLHEFERLTPPAFHVPDLQPRPPGASRLGSTASMRVHGSVVSVWGYARQADGAPMSMMLTGTDGLIDRWVRFAEEQLSSCWTPDQPDFGA